MLLFPGACRMLKKRIRRISKANGFGVAAPGSEQEFKTVVGDRVFFAEDQSMLSPEAQDTLRKQAAWLKQYRAVECPGRGPCR